MYTYNFVVWRKASFLKRCQAITADHQSEHGQSTFTTQMVRWFILISYDIICIILIGYHLQTSKYHFYYFRWGLRATRIYQTTLQTSSDLRRFIRCKRYQINIHPKPFKKYIHSFNRHSSVANYYHTAFLPVLYCSKTDLRRAEYAKLAITWLQRGWVLWHELLPQQFLWGQHKTLCEVQICRRHRAWYNVQLFVS